jgi:hypothetical protein
VAKLKNDELRLLWRKHSVNDHLKMVFADNESETGSEIRNCRRIAHDGKSYDTQHDYLVVIIVHGHKVNSVCEADRLSSFVERSPLTSRASFAFEPGSSPKSH